MWTGAGIKEWCYHHKDAERATKTLQNRHSFMWRIKRNNPTVENAS